MLLLLRGFYLCFFYPNWLLQKSIRFVNYYFFFILGVTFLKSYIVQWFWWGRRTFVIRRLENKIWCVFLDENISPTSVVFKGRLISESFSLLLKFPKKCAKSPSWALSTYLLTLNSLINEHAHLAFLDFLHHTFNFLH